MPVVLWLVIWCVLAPVFAPRANADDSRLIPVGSYWRYFKGLSEPPGAFGSWRTNDFDDARWNLSMSGFSTAAYAPEPGYLLDYGYGYRTLYLRKTFHVSKPDSLAEMAFRVDYDDGFVVYLNGQEIARRGIAGPPNAPLAVDTYATNHLRGVTEEIDVSNAIPLLRPGENLLAIQVFGSGTNDYTVALVPELVGNFTREPYLQNTTSNSTQIVFKTLSPSPAVIEVRSNGVPLEPIALSAPDTNHVATLTGLAPDAAYEYRVVATVRNQAISSDWHSLRTFKSEGAIRFAVLGDSGWGSAEQHRIAALMKAAKPDLLMHLGDVIYPAYTHSMEDFRCFSVYAEQLWDTPMFLALGNHDMYWNSTAALESFYLPTNSATGTEHYYSFDHGDAHFVVAWSDLEVGSDYRPGSTQFKWIDQDLAASTKPWKFMFFHHVWRSSGPHGGDDYDQNSVPDSAQIEDGLITLARKHGVQVVFNGHDHDYERFTPSGGVLSVVSGGGGAALYVLRAFHPDNVQYFRRQEFLNVRVDGNEATIEAVGLDGNVFDRLHLRRSLPERTVATAAWNAPTIELFAPSDGDGNIAGQRFDFVGNPVGGKVGQFSSTGRLFVNSDHRNLYLGLDEVMLHGGDELFLFLETPGFPGLTEMSALGRNIPTNSLQTLGGLAFTNFSPGIGMVLGDELGDGGFTNFVRAGCSNNTGQGAFYLDGLILVPGQKLTQFNHSPQDPPFEYEQNANFIKIALPLSAIGARAGDRIKVGAIVGLRSNSTNGIPFPAGRQLDSGIGYSIVQNLTNTYLEPVEFELSTDLDPDGDGLTSAEESVRGTDPNDADSDHDGLPDGWEVANGCDPLRGDAQVDLDGDGMSNRDEFTAGTNPKDPVSRLVLSAAAKLGGQIELRWSSIPGKLYWLEGRSSLQEAYEKIEDLSLPRRAAGLVERFTIALSAGQAARYYRLVVAPE